MMKVKLCKVYTLECQQGDEICFRYTGFALPIAIVAKCEEIINLAQKILIWRQLLAKEKSQVNFFVWRRNPHLRLQVIASCRLMVINVN